MALDPLGCCEPPQFRPLPRPATGNGEAETVRDRQARDALATGLGMRDTLGLKLLDPQSQVDQARSVETLQFPAIEYIRHGKFEGKAEGRLDQGSALQVDQDRRVRHEDLHRSGGFRMVHELVQLPDGNPEDLGRLGFGNRPLGQRAEAEALQAARLFKSRIHRADLRKGRPSPAALAEHAGQVRKDALAENAEVPAATGNGLEADAKEALEADELAETDRRAVPADLGPERLGRHEKRARKAVAGLLLIDLVRDVEHHVAEFVGKREALALAPGRPVDHNNGHRHPVEAPDRGRQPVDVREFDGEHLDPAFFEQLHQIWDRVRAKRPVVADAARRALRVGDVADDRIGRPVRPVPVRGQVQQLFDQEVALQKVQRLCLELRLLFPARDGRLAELHTVERHLLLAKEVVLRHVERIGERDEHAGARHGFVALVFSDGLGRHPVSDLRLQIPERQAGGRPRKLKSSAYHDLSPLQRQFTKYQDC